MNKKLKKMKQIDGKVETVPQPKTLDHLFGATGGSKYGTLDVAAYEQSLNGMNRSDLQTHAIKCGLLPIDNKDTLILRLIREFNKHVNAFKIPMAAVKKDKDPSPELVKFLLQAR